ncbi:hypothetical protein GFB98_12775 [Klebsiella pneumoniae]|nr:hypothetical protein [Klebsiella pneumoniae]
MVCVVGRMRDLILQLSKSSIYSTKPLPVYIRARSALPHSVFRQPTRAFWLSLLNILMKERTIFTTITVKDN